MNQLKIWVLMNSSVDQYEFILFFFFIRQQQRRSSITLYIVLVATLLCKIIQYSFVYLCIQNISLSHLLLILLFLEWKPKFKIFQVYFWSCTYCVSSNLWIICSKFLLSMWNLLYLELLLSHLLQFPDCYYQNPRHLLIQSCSTISTIFSAFSGKPASVSSSADHS